MINLPGGGARAFALFVVLQAEHLDHEKPALRTSAAEAV